MHLRSVNRPYPIYLLRIRGDVSLSLFSPGGLEVGLYIILGFFVLLACFVILLLTYIRRKHEGQAKRERKSTNSLVSPPRPEKKNIQFFIPLSVETVPTLVQDSIREEDETERAANVENQKHGEVKEVNTLVLNGPSS